MLSLAGREFGLSVEVDRGRDATRAMLVSKKSFSHQGALCAQSTNDSCYRSSPAAVMALGLTLMDTKHERGRQNRVPSSPNPFSLSPSLYLFRLNQSTHVNRRTAKSACRGNDPTRNHHASRRIFPPHSKSNFLLFDMFRSMQESFATGFQER
ncbi:hypothetical protein BST61_g4222 [Cercospora zeina]